MSELGLLSLEEVGRHQAGCYACEADNGFSITPVTKEVTLIVQCESFSSTYCHISIFGKPTHDANTFSITQFSLSIIIGSSAFYSFTPTTIISVSANLAVIPPITSVLHIITCLLVLQILLT